MDMDLVIKTGTKELIDTYIDQLIEIDQYHFGKESWSKESFISHLPGKFSNSLLMFKENKVVGYAIVSKKVNNFHIHRFVICKHLTSMGYGKKLLAHLEKNVLIYL